MRPDEVKARERRKRLEAFGPCPCGCGEPRRKCGLTASDECVIDQDQDQEQSDAKPS